MKRNLAVIYEINAKTMTCGMCEHREKIGECMFFNKSLSKSKAGDHRRLQCCRQAEKRANILRNFGKLETP